ncbi:MAG: hypothetical protein KDJ50_08550 [Alphaproteobacteria bacterium]|nr:hypothetical protein [Alphaproteobacteria bacterium]
MEAIAMDHADMTANEQQVAPQVEEHSTANFDVYAAFSRLDTARKMTLFDQLFGQRMNAYKNSIKSFWPEASEEDGRKLAMMLKSRMDRLQFAE